MVGFAADLEGYVLRRAGCQVTIAALVKRGLAPPRQRGSGSSHRPYQWRGNASIHAPGRGMDRGRRKMPDDLRERVLAAVRKGLAGPPDTSKTKKAVLRRYSVDLAKENPRYSKPGVTPGLSNEINDVTLLHAFSANSDTQPEKLCVREPRRRCRTGRGGRLQGRNCRTAAGATLSQSVCFPAAAAPGPGPGRALAAVRRGRLEVSGQVGRPSRGIGMELGGPVRAAHPVGKSTPVLFPALPV